MGIVRDALFSPQECQVLWAQFQNTFFVRFMIGIALPRGTGISY